MEEAGRSDFSGPVAVFHYRRLPEKAVPAGYAALIEAFHLRVPLPLTLSAIGPRHKQYEQAGWAIYTPRHAPRADVAGHLTFAIKHEGLDLAVLSALFRATGPGPIEELVRGSPTGTNARRIWFLYEWLLGAELDLSAADRGAYALVVDPERQAAGSGKTSPRHRLKNNLPGTPLFCPMITWTETLRTFVARDLAERARCRGGNPRRSAGTHGRVLVAQRFQVQLRH